jgi:hypothetical protein
MRASIAACMFAFVACSPPSSPPQNRAESTVETATSGSIGARRVDVSAFALDGQALVGRWSFDRSCGLYDLVFNADATVNYYDYGDERHVVAYAGRWARADHNRIVMSLHRLAQTGGPTGEALTYAFDVSEPVSDDLIGQFGVVGRATRAISAKRCPEEDRE